MRGKGNKPRYLLVKEGIVKEIKTGNYQVGEKLPGERKIAYQYNVSQMTANRAIQELVQEGYLEREMGVGTFVVSRDPASEVPAKINIVLLGDFIRNQNDYEKTLQTVHYLARDVYMGTMLRNLMEVGRFHKCEFSIITASTSFELEDYVARADRMRERFVIVNPLYNWQECLDRIGRSGIPIVAINASWENMGVPFVDADNYLGAQMAISHLGELGHKDILVFYSWPETANTQQRIKGAKDKMTELGIPYTEDQFININAIGIWALKLIQEKLEVVLRRRRVTAIFAAGFELALAANSALKNLNISIPDEISLVGFDDSPAAIYLEPPLTTIKQPFYEIAEAAIDILINPENKSSKLIPAELILRSSTGLARKASTNPFP